MTSKQVMLTAWALLLLGGCAFFHERPAPQLASPYPTRRLWAVAPLLNQSGSLLPDGAALADQFQHRLENASGISVLPVNRTLGAMQTLGISSVASPTQAMQIMHALDADALLVGAITAYSPYDPPRLGIALELYVNEKIERADAADLRQLVRTPVDAGLPMQGPQKLKQPTTTVSDVLDASDPGVRERLKRYAVDRGAEPNEDAWRQYRISMDLYSEFVSYVMSWRLLDAERRRINPPPQNTTPAR